MYQKNYPHIIKSIFLIILLSMILLNCKKTTSPITDLKIDMKIIPVEEVEIDFEDSTYYQHDVTCCYNVAQVESTLQIMAKSNIQITAAWYPEASYECGPPIAMGESFIIKLAVVDTQVYQYNFIRGRGYPIGCNSTWRHYVFSK
jgi:hypothetical protein